MEPEGQERGEGWEQGRGQGRDQGEEQEGKWDEKWGGEHGGEQGRGSVTTAVIQLSRSAPGLTQCLLEVNMEGEEGLVSSSWVSVW